jgi:predicted nucleic acid-binding protein
MRRGFLLDTNVPSELTRPRPDPRVAQWLDDTDDDLMYLSVITIGEVCKGITVHPEAHRRAGSECQLRRIRFNAPDGLIAATALGHDIVIRGNPSEVT